MKKVLFTVFAVIGFSTISVANNHVEVLELNNAEVKSVIVLNNNCDERQQIATDLCAESDCGGSWEAYFYGASEWGRCMAGN